MTGYGNAGADRALARWKERALRWVLLPSGTWAQIRLPTALGMIAANLLPDSLVAVAVQFAQDGIETDKLTGDTLREFEQFRTAMMAQALVAIDPDAKPDPEHRGQPLNPQPIALDISGATLYDLPGDDQTALQLLVDRRVTPEQCTFRSLAMHDLLASAPTQPDNAQPATPAEDTQVGGRDLETFRSEPEGGSSRPDGGTVRDPA